jgi:endonuclease YncB( thermonuclease family)
MGANSTCITNTPHFRFVLWCVGFWILSFNLAAKETPWTRYEACYLDPDTYLDGDSMNGVSGLREGAKRRSKMNWRLYGVDCPENDNRNSVRVAEQAEAFGTSEEVILAWGRKASEFTFKFLESGQFEVFTRKEDAKGASVKNRYYAIVLDSEGKPLHEALLEAGLARAYGWNTAWPDGTPQEEFEERLQKLERTARAAGVGIWSGSPPP